MNDTRTGLIAVIFTSRRNGRDATGYARAATAMADRAATQPGFRGMESARGDDGFGITVSYWADEAAARAWRDDPVHAAIRERGRTLWYDDYRVTIASVTRDYGPTDT